VGNATGSSYIVQLTGNVDSTGVHELIDALAERLVASFFGIDDVRLNSAFRTLSVPWAMESDR
jgi:hypothetical protein